MLKYMLFSAGFITAFCQSDAQNKKNIDNFFIKASLHHWDSTYVSLMIDGETVYADSVLNGEFNYKGHIDGTKEGTFVIQKKSLTVTMPIYIEPGTILIQDYERNFVRFNITGIHNEMMKRFYVQLDSAYPSHYASEQEGKAIAIKRSEYIRQYIQKNRDSLVTLALFRNYILKSEMSEDEKLSLFSSLNGSLRNTNGGKDIYKKINQLINTSVGKTAPSFSLADTSDRMVTLQSFRNQYVLLDFWASWCGPCRAENPAIKNAFEKYRHKGFTIVSVSLDSEKKDWLSAIKKDQLPWTHLSDLKGWKNSVAQMYWIESIPSNFLLDPNGVIIAKNLDGKDLESRLAVLTADKTTGRK